MWGVYEHLTGYNGPCGCCVGSVNKSARPEMMVLLAKKINDPIKFLQHWQAFPLYYKNDIEIVRRLAKLYPEFTPLFQVYVDEKLEEYPVKPRQLPVVVELEFEPETDEIPSMADMSEKLAAKIKEREDHKRRIEDFMLVIEDAFKKVDKSIQDEGVWSIDNKGKVSCKVDIDCGEYPITLTDFINLYGENRGCKVSWSCSCNNAATCTVYPNEVSKEQKESVKRSAREKKEMERKEKKAKVIYGELKKKAEKEEEERDKLQVLQKIQNERAQIETVVRTYFEDFGNPTWYWGFCPAKETMVYSRSVRARSEENTKEAIRRIVKRLEGRYEYEVKGDEIAVYYN
jgi:hypothetical protein